MRLIDADEIVKVAEHAFREWNLAMAAAEGKRQINRVYKMQELCKAVKAVADSAPTIDAAPVVRGRWIKGENWSVTCSVCGSLGIANDGKKYCPYCGAKMDEEG